jgi:hypothetical protein
MTQHRWTDKIPSEVVCGYFYVFFLIFSVWAGLSLLGGLWIFASSKMSVGQLVSVMFNVILSFGISATSALFLYLICDRALKPLQDSFEGSQGGLDESVDLPHM